VERIVVDTNVLLVSISERSKLHWLFKGLLTQQFMLCVTTDILAEYAEIIEQHMGHHVSESVMGVFDNLPNIVLITSYYKFQLLNDEDDNKFVDCAVAANARFIVSHDKDFNKLRNIDFPKVLVIDTNQFKEILEEWSS
jgi:putative PIN family toxin of toxin-antitoxin system